MRRSLVANALLATSALLMLWGNVLPHLTWSVHKLLRPPQPRLRSSAAIARHATDSTAMIPDAAATLELPVVGDDYTRKDVQELKWSLVRLAAAMDRGQAYNPTSGEYYAERMEVARGLIEELISQSPSLPSTLASMDGEWELIFATVKHGIFRSSPFFLAVQEAFGDREKSELFFKLHELQVMSWGASKVGRVAQYINSTEGRLYSEFDTSLLSLTVIPVLGWWKLLPTFGGCVVTASDVQLVNNRLEMEVQYTEAKQVPGLPSLSDFVMGKQVPVNAIWQLLPWNGGRKPTCSVELKYLDKDLRIVADADGDMFVYTRPVDPRGL